MMLPFQFAGFCTRCANAASLAGLNPPCLVTWGFPRLRNPVPV